jgi:hypothetical protein
MWNWSCCIPAWADQTQKNKGARKTSKGLRWLALLTPNSFIKGTLAIYLKGGHIGSTMPTWWPLGFRELHARSTLLHMVKNHIARRRWSNSIPNTWETESSLKLGATGISLTQEREGDCAEWFQPSTPLTSGRGTQAPLGSQGFWQVSCVLFTTIRPIRDVYFWRKCWGGYLVHPAKLSQHVPISQLAKSTFSQAQRKRRDKSFQLLEEPAILLRLSPFEKLHTYSSLRPVRGMVKGQRQWMQKDWTSARGQSHPQGQLFLNTKHQ